MSIGLPAGIYAANVRGDLVFLDARRNEYSCIPRSQAEGLLDTGAPCDLDLVDELEADGLLTRDPGKIARGLEGPKPTAVADWHGAAAPPADPLPILAFARAAVRTGAAMIRQRPKKWLERRRKRSTPEDAERALAVAQAFNRLRPWVPGSGRCVPSSMLLLELLKRHGIEADWVFGVRTYPFEAHCWVEKDGTVLNDTLEHVRWFTPIAVG
jgi:hypothetical protein